MFYKVLIIPLVLNIPEFWITQDSDSEPRISDSECARLFFLIYYGREYASGFEYGRILNIPKF